MTDRARKLFSWVVYGLAILWLALSGLDIVIDLNRGHQIPLIEIVIAVAVGLMLWLVGYVIKYVR